MQDSSNKEGRIDVIRVMFIVSLLGICVQSGNALAQVTQIRVGPNVQVSRAQGSYSFYEVLLTADPTDANRLLGCGILYAESENRAWTVVYLSADGGQTWQPTLETKRMRQSADPACALGRNGLAVHIALGFDLLNPETRIPGIEAAEVYRSTDGGKTWAQQEDIPLKFQGMDRESVTIDATQGKFNNRVYITGTSINRFLDGTARNGFAVWRSRDGGIAFDGPLKRAAAANHHLLETGNSVILSDGTMVSIFGDLKNHESDGLKVSNTSEESNAVLESVITTDGGDSVSEATRVDDFFMVRDHKDSGRITMGMPTIAADQSDGPFHDRLYATWGDERAGRSAIRFAYSSDKAKSWSRSIVIDDLLVPKNDKKGPENFQPTVAVNKAGVVAVTWYDRRDNPDGLGWYLRFRASLDGGDTWLPSVRVSEKPNTFSIFKKLFTYDYANPYGAVESRDEKEKTQNPIHENFMFQPRQFYAGDYAGLAADANGIFHAFWIDNRTGLTQIWTAPIFVDGRAIRNGDVTLSELKDVSHDVELEIVSSNYDRVSDTLAVGVRLRNWSKKSIHGPVKLRLVNISSMLGSPFCINADNHLAQPGALWDFSSSLRDNILNPDEASGIKQIIFRVNGSRDFFDGEKLYTDLLSFDTRVLAGEEESPAKSAAEKSSSAN